MSSFLFGRSLRAPSLSSKHSDAAKAISSMDELNDTDSSSKSPEQLEHALDEYERHLGHLLRTLSPSGEAKSSVGGYTKEEHSYVSKKCEDFMAQAESLKAVILVKKDRIAAEEQTAQFRLSEARSVARRSEAEERERRARQSQAEERERRASMQEETRRRLGEARLEDGRRRSSTGGKGERAKPQTGPRRSSFGGPASSKLASRRPSPPNTAARASPPAPARSGAARKPSAPSRVAASRSSPPTKKYTSLEQSIVDEVLTEPPSTSWDDIAGLTEAKTALQETVILPTLRPDIFTGLRAPPKGVLLFGPPGTGKTMIARACASESGFSFFAVSASALTSKWVGEGEKMMKALFSVAHDYAPSVVFMDEIDSVLSKRKSEGEHEASRRLKTEFLVQIDGVNSSANDPEKNVLVVGATNLPFDLDDAVLRRFGRRIYVPLPDSAARRQIFCDLLAKNRHSLTKSHITTLVAGTENFSASDITNLCKESSMGPLRQISMTSLAKMDSTKVPAIEFKHFEKALRGTQPSVSMELLRRYDEYK